MILPVKCGFYETIDGSFHRYSKHGVEKRSIHLLEHVDSDIARNIADCAVMNGITFDEVLATDDESRRVKEILCKACEDPAYEPFDEWSVPIPMARFFMLLNYGFRSTMSPPSSPAGAMEEFKKVYFTTYGEALHNPYPVREWAYDYSRLSLTFMTDRLLGYDLVELDHTYTADNGALSFLKTAKENSDITPRVLENMYKAGCHPSSAFTNRILKYKDYYGSLSGTCKSLLIFACMYAIIYNEHYRVADLVRHSGLHECEDDELRRIADNCIMLMEYVLYIK